MTIDEAYNTCFGKPYIVPIDKHEEAKSIIRHLIEEVKQYREIGTVEECRNSVLDITKAYNKAIDDFVEYIWETTSSSDIEWITRDYELYDLLQKKAEQLKAGGNIELSEHSKSQGNRTGK